MSLWVSKMVEWWQWGGGGVRGVGSPVMRAAVVGEILGRLKGVLQASSPAQRAGCWAAVFLSLELGGGS